MKTIIVDDEHWGLERFTIECANMPEIELVGEFRDAEDAVRLAKNERIDLALLDIQMPGMNGFDLADELREMYPDIIIIFISAFEEYYKEALKVRKADYFLLKPYTSEEVFEVLERAKLLSARQNNCIRIQTFGKFQVFVNEQPLRFSSQKAEELLALMVDKNGDPLTTEEAFSAMWENLPYSHTEAGRYRKALQKLQNILIEAGAERLLLYFPHARAIRKEMVKCDYFDFLDGDMDAIKKYRGEYMSQYSWAENRIFSLNSFAEFKDPEAKVRIYM